LVDIIIIIFLISALLRGREVGFVQQLLSTVGFFGGLLLGATLEPRTVQLAHTALSRSLITLATTLGLAFIFLGIGEHLGMSIKHRFQLWHLDRYDNFMGSLLGAVSLLIAVWLSASILTTLPFPGLQSSIRSSKIVSFLSANLPPAPNIVADLGHLINPNGFPQVFSGNEPSPPAKISLPQSSALQAAVDKDKLAVVKVEGQGCGGVVEGSGFVIGSDLVATNAHVVAGIEHPFVQDSNGLHNVTVLWFDPNLDFAVLRVPNLAGGPLVLNPNQVSNGTPAAVIGYPGGGGLKAGTASVIDEFLADGRNIYDQGTTERDVYEIAADIIPGNSGGPLITEDGSVIGIVFAESVTYNHVGYALTLGQIISEIHQAEAQNQVVSTGNCAG